MTTRNTWTVFLFSSLLVVAVGLSGCGRRGSLERPPARDHQKEDADKQNLSQISGQHATGVRIHASL